ncbi:MAG TPA: LysM peptidoglycan-binding domain-containing protein [Anaerolineales bacterium]|nr:LysM peptidoglycan-binding domain-containing protein [Anaerolineales bacterium]
MARKNKGATAAFTLLLVVIVASACNQPYSQAPSVTNTPINPTSFFATGETPDMNDVAAFGTSTALALSGTPQAIATQTLSVVGTQDLSATVTPTALVTSPAGTVTATLAVSGTLPTSAPVGTRPAEWTLRKGEFPYCIARRFDVNPSTLLSLNGLSNGNIFYPGRTLKIPQSGSFPGERALKAHTPHRVGSSSETLYSIACLYGDVRPEDIASANNLASADAALTSGQQLNIP